MSKSLKRYFFNFEGLDGCGKDTQLNAFVTYLRSDNSKIGNKYANIWVTREPTRDSGPGIEISNLMRKRDVTKEEATSYFISDRIIHSDRVRDLLKDSFVATARFDLSTYAFQMNQGMSFDVLYDMHAYGKTSGALIPDITFVFDIPVIDAMNRIGARDGIEECFEKEDFQRGVYDTQNKAINLLEEKDGRKFIRVDANQPIEHVTQEMISKTENYILSLK